MMSGLMASHGRPLDSESFLHGFPERAPGRTPFLRQYKTTTITFYKRTDA